MSKMLKHPLIIAICNGIIFSMIGIFLTAYFARQNLHKQMQLELYKDLIHQQSEFVDHLSKDIYSRVYKLSTYFENLKSGDKIKAEEFWRRYREESVSWSEELRFYLTNLDRYFPKQEFKIGKYIIATELFKNHLDYSFRQALENDIQPRFFKINDAVSRLNRIEPLDKQLDGGQINNLKKEINSLYMRVYEFTEALSKASTYYKISTKTKLLQDNF